MKLELGIKRFNNEDVIATSSCASTNLYLVEGEPGHLHAYNLNNESAQYSGSASIPSTIGFYHLEGGIFVVCPTWNGQTGAGSNESEVASAHGVQE